jgi:hypothetical protein
MGNGSVLLVAFRSGFHHDVLHRKTEIADKAGLTTRAWLRAPGGDNGRHRRMPVVFRDMDPIFRFLEN